VVAAGDETLDEVAFIVRRVAKDLSMPTENIELAPEFVKRMDQLGLIRRLIQKGNMQMRFITLEIGWYKKDSGVIIGYYGQNKELATFLPVAPDKYELVTRKNPQGVFIDDEIANNIDSDAFACYAGLPLKQLKTVDLMKFMFAQGWKSDFRLDRIKQVINEQFISLVFNFVFSFWSLFLMALMEIQSILLTMIIYYIAYYHLKPEFINYAQFLAFQAAFTGFNLTFRQVLPLINRLNRS